MVNSNAAPQLRIVTNQQELFREAANEFAAIARQSVADRGKFTVALSGGSTPRGMNALLAQDASLPWDRSYFFFGDERHAPPTDAESNYRMAAETLLSKIHARPENVFRIHTEEQNAEIAADSYEQTLRAFFRVQPGQFPRFDLILLGMGPDGHTASLFPGSKALAERNRWVVANWVEKFQTHRVTLTYPVLNQAACVMFVVSGQDKADALRDVLESQGDGPPAKYVRPVNGSLVWLVDQAAAGQLKNAGKNNA